MWSKNIIFLLFDRDTTNKSLICFFIADSLSTWLTIKTKTKIQTKSILPSFIDIIHIAYEIRSTFTAAKRQNTKHQIRKPTCKYIDVWRHWRMQNWSTHSQKESPQTRRLLSESAQCLRTKSTIVGDHDQPKTNQPLPLQFAPPLFRITGVRFSITQQKKNIRKSLEFAMCR